MRQHPSFDALQLPSCRLCHQLCCAAAVCLLVPGTACSAQMACALLFKHCILVLMSGSCAALQALDAEKEAIAREKEMEVARLRAMQEKQADHQSEQDELRARRYQVRGTG